MPEPPPDPARDLRIATYAVDGPAILAALAEALEAGLLQAAGDGVLIALAQEIPGAQVAAGSLSTALRDREGPGDDDLADQLDAAIGRGPHPMLKSLRVDLEELSMILEGDPMVTGGRIDVQTGDVIHESPYEDSSLDDDGEDADEEDLDDADRWLYVGSEGSRARAWLAGHGYRPTPGARP